MGDKPKVPPRIFYSLEQASKELGCEISHLIHLGATDTIKIAHYFNGDAYAFPSIYWRGHDDENNKEAVDQIKNDYIHINNDIAFLIVPAWALMEYELEGAAIFHYCKDIASIHPNGMVLHWESSFKIGNVMRIFGAEEKDINFLGFSLYHTSNRDREYCGISIKQNMLFIFHDELEKLRQPEALPATEAAQNNSAPLRPKNKTTAFQKTPSLIFSDATHESYPPELHTAAMLWEALYINGEKNPNHSHEQAAKLWLEKNLDHLPTAKLAHNRSNALISRLVSTTTPDAKKPKK